MTSIWEYESPTRTLDVPDGVAEAMRDLLNDFEAAADRLAREAEAPETEGTPRYRKTAAFWDAVPELRGWPMLSQGLLLAEVQRRVPGTVVSYV